MRIIVFILGLMLSGCPAIQSMDSFAKGWIGEPIERYKKAYERNRSWNNVKSEKKGNIIIYHVIDNHFDFGSCYLDLFVDESTEVIVDYRVHGDKYACK